MLVRLGPSTVSHEGAILVLISTSIRSISGMGIRFGFQMPLEHESDPIGAARRAEELGFDVVLVADHIGPGVAPLSTLAAIAQETETIRLGTLVLNNDMRNPVQLAWETTTLDRLSGGRFELGLGAGHTPQEYVATDTVFDPPRHRKERLAESVEIIRRLIDGHRVDFSGDHYTIEGAQIDPAVQDHLPILVGGNGEALLSHAGAHAAIIGLQGLGRTRPNRHRHTVNWHPDWLTTQIEQVRTGAGDRFERIELNALVQVVEITHDRDSALAAICERVEGLDPHHAAQIPYLLVGSVDQIAEHILACRQRWGISYYAVRELDAFAEVITAVKAAG
jgi:probable F420-dependent oxidoreductase